MIRLEELYADPAPAAASAAERAILLAAIQLFGERGYAATSVRLIAAAAGVTPPLIAYHFASKEGLFESCVVVVNEGLAQILLEKVERGQEIGELVRVLAETYLEFPKQHPGAVRLLLAVAYGPEEMWPGVDVVGPWNRVLDRVEARFAGAIEDGRFLPRPGASPTGLTRHLFHLLHMAVFAEHEKRRFVQGHGQKSRFLAPVDDPVAEIVDQFFLGAGRPATPTDSMKEAR